MFTTTTQAIPQVQPIQPIPQVQTIPQQIVQQPVFSVNPMDTYINMILTQLNQMQRQLDRIEEKVNQQPKQQCPIQYIQPNPVQYIPQVQYVQQQVPIQQPIQYVQQTPLVQQVQQPIQQPIQSPVVIQQPIQSPIPKPVVIQQPIQSPVVVKQEEPKPIPKPAPIPVKKEEPKPVPKPAPVPIIKKEEPKPAPKPEVKKEEPKKVEEVVEDLPDVKRDTQGKPLSPPPAFFLFIDEQSERIDGENPGLGEREKVKLLREEWKQLGSEVQALYEEQRTELMKDYEIALKSYEASGYVPVKSEVKPKAEIKPVSQSEGLGGLFQEPVSSGPFGKVPSSGFGNPFGQAPSSGFGTPFGTAPSGGFGNPFGTAPSSGFGTPFGQAPSSGFGTTFGTAPSGGFGEPFGTTPSSGFGTTFGTTPSGGFGEPIKPIETKETKKVEEVVEEKPKGIKKDLSGKPLSPPPAFFLFIEEQSERIDGENPDLGEREKVKLLREEWKQLGPEVQALYEEQRAELMKDYEIALKEWESSP